MRAYIFMMSVRSLCRCVASGRLDAKNIRRYSSKGDSLDDLAEMEVKMKAAIALQKKTIEAAETMGETQGKDPWYLATLGAAGINVLLAWRMLSEKAGHEVCSPLSHSNYSSASARGDTVCTRCNTSTFPCCGLSP